MFEICEVYEEYVPVEELKLVCKAYMKAVILYGKSFSKSDLIPSMTTKEAAEQTIEEMGISSIWVNTFEYWMQNWWVESIEWAIGRINPPIKKSKPQKRYDDEKQLMLLVNNLSKKNVPSIRVVELTEDDNNVASVLDINEYRSNQTLAIKSHIKEIFERGNYVDVCGVTTHGELIFE
jgi:ribosomal protein L3